MNHGKSKIRVLFVTASTKGGGAERMLFNIIRSLNGDHEARLFITSSEAAVYHTDDVFTSVNANKKHAVSAFSQLVKEIRRFKPHHIFTTSSNVGYMLVLAKKLLRADFKIYIRCAVTPSEIYHADLKNRLLNKVIRATYNSADLIIAQTDFMRQDLIQSYGIKPEKVRTIRNIVDKEFVLAKSREYEAPELNPAHYNIVAAGALYSVKGFDMLIDALAPIVKHKSDVMLYILGEERYEVGYKSFLEEKIREYGLSGQIQLLGQKENPYPYFKAADLFVMSSRKEGFPNVVLEALSLGVPVVTTDCVDFTGTIEPGVNGFVVARSVESIRAGIELAINTNFNVNHTLLTNYDYNELFG